MQILPKAIKAVPSDCINKRRNRHLKTQKKRFTYVNLFNLFRRRLSTQAKFCNDSTVTVDVTILQVVEE